MHEQQDKTSISFKNKKSETMETRFSVLNTEYQINLPQKIARTEPLGHRLDPQQVPHIAQFFDEN